MYRCSYGKQEVVVRWCRVGTTPHAPGCGSILDGPATILPLSWQDYFRVWEQRWVACSPPDEQATHQPNTNNEEVS